MNKPLVVAAIAEAATGLALLVMPSVVGQLLVGTELTGVGVIMARQAGIGMLFLAVACWPGTPLLAMLGYSVASAVYLAYLSVAGAASGAALWPAAAWHLVMAVLLARAVRSGKTSTEGKSS